MPKATVFFVLESGAVAWHIGQTMSYLPEGEPEPEAQSVPVSRTYEEIEQASQRALEITAELARKPAGEWSGAIFTQQPPRR